MIEIVGVAKERACRGDDEVSVHIQVHTENRSVLGIFRLIVCLFHDSNVEVIVAIPVLQRSFSFLPVVRKIDRRRYVLVR
jgi:hypothetical protein